MTYGYTRAYLLEGRQAENEELTKTNFISTRKPGYVKIMGTCIFPLPQILVGSITPADYNEWVRVKAWSLYKRDKKRKLPLAITCSVSLYKEAVHKSVMAATAFDPYTGKELLWGLIGQWNPQTAKTDENYMKRFYRMPTIDHVDPYAEALSFEICSWEINSCKSFLTRNQFLALCERVTSFVLLDITGLPQQSKDLLNNAPHAGFQSRLLLTRKKARAPLPSEMIEERPWFLRVFGVAPIYLLPLFLAGTCTVKQYDKWLLARAKSLYKRDKINKRLCAMASSRSLYRKAIHAAVYKAGPRDPYTGDTLLWDKIGTWNTTSGIDNHDIFRKEFTLLPTVDHRDPAMVILDFEICSWMINCCKSCRTPQEFVELCREVREHLTPKMN